MLWARESHVFLNTNLDPGAILLRDKTGQAAASRLEHVAADFFTVHLWLRKPGTTNGEAATAVEIGPTDKIIYSGKQNAGGSLLFSAAEWAKTGEGDDVHYVADLDLNTVPLLALFTGTTTQVIIVGEIEVQNEANTRRLSAQFPILIRKQVYAGEGAPTPGPPVYPLPEALVTKTPVNGAFRVKTDETGSYWQVKNRTTGKWHTVFADGAEGAEYLTQGPGED